MKIDIHREEDRLTVAAILVKNGYTVRVGRRHEPGKKTVIYYVETIDKEKDNA